MNDMKTPYEFIYDGMSAKDRANMEADLANVVQAACKDARTELLKGVEAAVTSMYEKLSLNPTAHLVDGNTSHSYELVSAIREKLITDLCSNIPSDVQERILNAWRYNFPEKFKYIVNAAHLERIELLEVQIRNYRY